MKFTTIALAKETKLLLDSVIVPKYIKTNDDRILWLIERANKDDGLTDISKG